jgi:gliding motility-associated-like protein
VPTQTNCVYFSWFPSIGVSDTTAADPTLTPPYNTYYRVSASTEAGCWVYDSLSIRVNPSTLMTIPNAFHPGPGVNGVLYVIKQGAAVLNYIRIYNRWGVMVFESNDINKGWDGTYKGVAQPLGVYVYELEATTAYGSVFQQQGNVTLIR